MSTVRDLYAELGITLLRAAGSEAPARCFATPEAHRREDRHPSVSVNLDSGAWLCHGCGARGGAYDAALLRGHTPRSAMDLLISHGLAEPRWADAVSPGTTTTRPIVSTRSPAASQPSLRVTEAQITAWARRLTRRADIVARLEAERAISAQTLDRFQIGHDGRRITIPVRGRDGGLAGVLRWLPLDRGTAPKMVALPGTRRELFPAPERLPPGPIMLCEGEPDALAAHSTGLAAVAIPGVAGWRNEWAARFTGREVTVVTDCDDEGRACARRIAHDLADAAVNNRVVDLAPDRGDGYDLTDDLLAGRSINALRR